MTKRVVVATSTSCLDYFPGQHDVRILRLHVSLDEQDYLDGQDIRADDFNQWLLDNPGQLARTSPPTFNEIVEFFVDLSAQGYQEALVLTLSSALSQTHQHLLEAKKLFAGTLDILVFDTKTVCFCVGAFEPNATTQHLVVCG